MKNQTKKQLLAIDIGNTSILFAHYTGLRLKKTNRIATPQAKHFLKTVQKSFPLIKMDEVVMASVVPDVSRFLKRALERRLSLKVKLVGRDLSVPIKNGYKKPRQVGVDRLLNAFGAFSKYKQGLIIVDFGTAITLDVVTRRGEYLGGVIAPGIEISIDALFQRTALLPHIRLQHPSHIIGRDTIESIRIGCSHGIGGLCDRLIEGICSELHFNPLIIATGGYAAFMARYCHRIDKIEPHLTTDAMALLVFKKNS